MGLVPALHLGEEVGLEGNGHALFPDFRLEHEQQDPVQRDHNQHEPPEARLPVRGRALSLLGHAAAIGLVVLVATLLGMVLPVMAIRYSVAALLVGLGIYCMVGHHHPRWVRMQVGFRDLTVWSFLMASAHGAGLMVLPVLQGGGTVEAGDQMAGHHPMAASTSPLAGMFATVVHTTAYLAVTGLIAWVVYRKLGLGLLRKTWLNFNMVWGAALVITGLFTLFIS